MLLVNNCVDGARKMTADERRMLRLEWEQSETKRLLDDMVERASKSRHDMAQALQTVMNTSIRIETKLDTINKKVDEHEDRLDAIAARLLTLKVERKTRSKFLLGAGTGVGTLLGWSLVNPDGTHKFLGWLDKIFK